ncbi:1-acyl-sn-glycerol-3-phosphate acyltransferase beta-like [Achroia grisella]|uniref:1-acyl-sn-glycerol-3-phosphate acyltransferase beta-like n=1 Tax=Achroia grisella TaxID=688607 RepID=UPI0027D29821|nr:1-acyl-sn-glycerol-3-phosphate acyltransferase beta-like [Achroia grisella]
MMQNESNKIKYHSKFLFYYFFLSIVAFCLWPLFLLKPRHSRNFRWASKFSVVITSVLNVNFKLRNGEVLAEDRGAVIVANHQSSLDVLGMLSICKVAYKLTVAAKNELKYVWPFGLAAFLAGVIFVDRSNPKQAYKALLTTSHIMVQQKTKIWIYPEGTRNKDTTKFMTFKKGAFVMAVFAQVPIIPVVYSPYYFIDKEKHIFKKGHVIMQCLEPIPTKGLTLDDVPELIKKIRDKMFITYIQLTKEVLDNLTADSLVTYTHL